jgi:ABC-type bacteriocin/lantibiotic exporter with double-glycine peptidase domain
MKKIILSIVNNLKAIYTIIPDRLKRQYVKIILLSFVLALVEFTGLSMLIPFFNEVTDTKGFTYALLLNQVLPQPISFTPQQSILFSVTTVVILLFAKNSISIFIVFKQYKFGSYIQAAISEGLFSAYLKKSYGEIVNKNSSELIRNAIPETNKLNESVVVPSFFLITDFALVTTIVLFLIIAEPLSSVILFAILGGFYAVPVYFFGKKLTAWGKERFVIEGQRVKLVQEGLGAFIDIKLRNAVGQYLQKYSKVNAQSARYGYLLNSNLQVPKLALEVFIFLALLIMILVNTAITGSSNKDILKVLGLFAIAAYKLLPTLGRITNTIQTIRFYKPSMDVFSGLESSGKEQNLETEKPLTFSDRLDIQKLSLRYDSKVLLKDINFSIRKGETIGIIGTSGSGKTSLAFCILGLTLPSSGKIVADGVDINSNLKRWNSLIGYVPQTVFLLDDSIQTNITLNFIETDEVDHERLKLVTRQAGLADWISGLPEGYATRVGERGSQISGGQLQRIGIARALYRNPEMLVFDESTSALDSATEQQFLNTIESLKNEKTILFITHKRAPLKICTTILTIENGSIHVQKNNITV